MHQCDRCGSEIPEGIDECPQCGSRRRDGHAPQAGGTHRASKRRWLTYVIVIIILLVGLLAYFRAAFRSYHPVIEQQPDVPAGALESDRKFTSSMVQARVVGSFLIVSLTEVKQQRIVRFVDPEGKQTIPVLAYLTPSGRLVTAMSISENCRSTDFYLEGENIHCANCPSYWNASSLEAYACCQKYYPDPIPSTVLGDEIRIDVNDVRNWKARS